ALLAAPAHPHFRLAPPRRFGESERAEYACDFCIESPEPSRCPYDSGGAPGSFSISFGAGHAQGILRCALSSRAPLVSRTFHQRFELLSGSAVFWSFSHSTARRRHARAAAEYGRVGGAWRVGADFSRRQDDRCRGDFYVSARRRDDCIAAAGSGGPHPDSRIGSSLASHVEARNSRAYSRDIWQAAAVERRRLSRERTTSARGRRGALIVNSARVGSKQSVPSALAQNRWKFRRAIPSIPPAGNRRARVPSASVRTASLCPAPKSKLR